MLSSARFFDARSYSATSSSPAYQRAVRAKPSSSETSARHPRVSAARAGLAYQSWRSQARAGIVENSGSASMPNCALREVGEIADGRLAPAADVEGAAVMIRAQLDRRAQKRARHVIDVDEIARGLRLDEGRQAARRPHAPPASESSASGPRAGRKPNTAAGSRSASRGDGRKSKRSPPPRSWSPRNGCWVPPPSLSSGAAEPAPYSDELPAWM